MYYLYDTLTATGAYDVFLQPFAAEYAEGNASLSVNNASVEAETFTYNSGGVATGPVVLVSNFGCSPSDFPASIPGSVALISRGNCSFAIKGTNAAAAGAAGAIIYNNVPGGLSGTFGASGPYPPTAAVSLSDGQALASQLTAGQNLTATVDVYSLVENRTTYNVIATTKSGQSDHIVSLGAHTDSVVAGPGINDDGSGTIGILEVAKQLAKYTVNNAVRFCFWSAEEYGLLGSEYYVSQLNETEVARHRLYLNFDMIASPNYFQGIYDGDGSAFNISGPPGSAEIEKLFEAFYDANDEPHAPTEFSGRSDYGPFLDVGVPSGGLFTGAEGIKTAEEAEIFGGEAGVAYDANYHGAGDNVTNLNAWAYTINTKGIAFAVATYALSFDSLPPANTTTSSFSRRAGGPVHGHAQPYKWGEANYYRSKREATHVESRHGHSCGPVSS